MENLWGKEVTSEIPLRNVAACYCGAVWYVTEESTMECWLQSKVLILRWESNEPHFGKNLLEGWEEILQFLPLHSWSGMSITMWRDMGSGTLFLGSLNSHRKMTQKKLSYIASSQLTWSMHASPNEQLLYKTSCTFIRSLYWWYQVIVRLLTVLFPSYFGYSFVFLHISAANVAHGNKPECAETQGEYQEGRKAMTFSAVMPDA